MLCLVCGKEFVKKRECQKYCSILCNKKSWKLRHRDSYLLSSRKYNAKRKLIPQNIIKDKLATANWRKENPDKIRFYKYKRRALIAIDNQFSNKDWLAMKLMYNFSCLSCMKCEPEIKLTLDHIVPLSLGGRHTWDNIQPLCFSCNRNKQIGITDFRNKFFSTHLTPALIMNEMIVSNLPKGDTLSYSS